MSYTYDFNVIVDRSRERSKTWDPRNVKPGQLPMNGAEMHFACPIPVLEAVREVSECQVYGYPYFTDDFAQAAAGWMKRRHDWDVDYKWVEFVGGIVPGIAFAMQAMTKVGDGIIINTPAYSPFRDCIRDNDRKLVESGLLIDSEKGTVEFDWADMEAKFADPNNTCFILCDPQNPTGKSCTLEELKKIEELSKKYNVFVIVDEVHADFVFDGKRHICYPTVGDFAKGFSAVVINPSKTFNTAGFRTAAIIIPNQEIHDKTNVKIAAVKGYSRTITGVWRSSLSAMPSWASTSPAALATGDIPCSVSSSISSAIRASGAPPWLPPAISSSCSSCSAPFWKSAAPMRSSGIFPSRWRAPSAAARPRSPLSPVPSWAPFPAAPSPM